MTVSFAQQRANMIESQVRTNDVSDLALINAMATAPREEFVVESDKKFAYAEVEVSGKSGRKLMKARDFSKLAQVAKIDAGNKILIIAGAAGYSADVFAKLKTEVTIVDDLDCSFESIKCIKSDLATLSDIEDDTFDLVFVDNGVETIPSVWFDKLKDGGRLAAIVYETNVGSAKVFVKSGGIVSSKTYFEAKPPKCAALNRVVEFSL